VRAGKGKEMEVGENACECICMSASVSVYFREKQKNIEKEQKRDAKKENVWSESKSVPVRVRGGHSKETKRKCVSMYVKERNRKEIHTERERIVSKRKSVSIYV
jgi:hypothetical protein